VFTPRRSRCSHAGDLGVHAGPRSAIEDGTSTEVLTVTGGHPFWERARGWTPAGELLPGDEVFTSRGGWARIGGGTWIAGEQLVYNFEVEGAHTYFVGETGAWVHNSCFNRDQQALRALVRDVEGGMSNADADILLDFAREVDARSGFPFRANPSDHRPGAYPIPHWDPPTRPAGAPATGNLPHVHVFGRHIYVR